MKLKLLRSLGKDWPPAKTDPVEKYMEGGVYEVPTELGEKLLKVSLAETTDEPIGPPPPLHAPVVMAVPKAPMIGKAAIAEDFEKTRVGK